MIVPQPRFWFLVGLGILLAFAGAFQPGLEKWVIIYDLLLLGLLFLTAKITLPNREFEIVRTAPKVLSVRTENTIKLELKNKTKVALRGRLRDELSGNLKSEDSERQFQLDPNTALVMEYSVRPLERGDAVFHGLFLRIRGYLGLCEIQIRLGEPESVSIYPNVKAVQEFDFLNHRGRLSQIGLRRTRYRGVGTEFESLREFQDGDDTRRIDWNSTARRNKLVVKDYEVERNQSVILAIDAGRAMSTDAGEATKLDHVLDAALLVQNAVNKAGDLCGLIAFDHKVLCALPSRKGHFHTQSIVRALHDLLPSAIETNFQALAFQLSRHQKKRSLVILFTEIDSPAKAQRLVDSLRNLRHHHVWFVANVVDEELHQLLNQPIDSLGAAFDVAALVEAEENRKLARQILVKNGISFTEAEPQALAIQLIQKYFKAKQQGRLAN